MWPLSVAVDGGRWCRIRWGVRPGIIVSLELRMRAWRSVGVGGERNTWWIKRKWLLAMEVSAALPAIAVRGNAVAGRVVGGLLVCRGITHNPVCLHLLPHRIVRPQCMMVHPFFVKRVSHPAMQSVTTLTRECNAKPGMIWARHTVAGRLGKPNLQVCVDCTWLSLGRPATMGLLASCTLVTRVPVVRKLLVAPESEMAHLLMVSMSTLTVQRRVGVARAYGWMGVRQEGNIIWFRFILFVSLAPAGQKLLYQL
jgi:hypothetical protein